MTRRDLTYAYFDMLWFVSERSRNRIARQLAIINEFYTLKA